MRRFQVLTGAVLTGASAMLAAAAAVAQPAGYTVVPAAERLSLAGVLADAAPANQLVMGVLILATLGSLAAWAVGLNRLKQGETPVTALGWLSIVRSAGVMLGLLAASLTLLGGFLGIANVRPAPDMTIMAPGWAEAILEVTLGLLASTVAVICERSLEARVRRTVAG